MDKDLVILYSGGADSMLMLKLALDLGKEPLAVLIDYGQVHIEELEFAKKQLKKLKVDYQNVKISGLDIDSGLTGNAIKGQYENVSIYNVPARNSMFLTIAAGIAESNQIKEIWIGCDMSDFYGEFPDCKQEYIGMINKLFKIAFTYPIIVEAPLLGMTKEMVLSILKNHFDISESGIYSGYGEHL